MAISMTGFGASQLQTKKNQISVQVKSINGRFLEVKFRLPRAYMQFENELRSIVSDSLFRGSVDIYISKSSDEEKIFFKTSLAKAWLKSSQKLAKDLKIKFDPKFEDILKIPDLYQVEESQAAGADEKDLVVKALKNALEDCLKSKKAEGAKLSQNLLKLVGEVESFIKELDKKRPEMAELLKSNFEKKIKDLSANTGFDQQRVIQEGIYLTEKADIEEEVTRLKAHIQSFKKVMSEKGSIGKKLDFIVQEMHREINTMGAKTQVLNAIDSIINAKAFVEKIREQVQNIE